MIRTSSLFKNRIYLCFAHYYTFIRKRGDIMLDKSVPFYAVIMLCNEPLSQAYELPKGYSFVQFQPGMEFAWSRLQYSVGNFESLEMAQKSFDNEFSNNPDLLRRRMVFVCDDMHRAVACACLWVGKDLGRHVQRVHWLATMPEYQGQGIATALLAHLIEIYKAEGCTTGVYLTTQTYSYKAIGIYSKFGFVPYLGEKPQHFQTQGGDYEDETRLAWEIINEQIIQYNNTTSNTVQKFSLKETSISDENEVLPNMLYFDHISIFSKCKSCKVFEITAPHQSGDTLHSHDYFQIWYVTKGNCIHTVEGQEYKMLVGDAFLLPPNVTHRTVLSDGSSIICCEFYMEDLFPGATDIYFDKMLDITRGISFTLLFQKELQGTQPKFSLSYKAQHRVEQLMHAMALEYSQEEIYYEDYLHLQISELLLTFAREYTQFPAQESPEKVYDKYHSLVEDAIKYIDKNYEEPLTLEGICKISMVSKTYFCYLFKLLTKQTFVEYLTNVRLNRAMELLLQTDQPIIDISQNVGFRDSTHFSRTFRRLRGISPREYRLSNTRRNK